jgi:hypothetical protein
MTHAQWADITRAPWQAMTVLGPAGTTLNDQQVAAGSVARQDWDLEAIAINCSLQQVNLAGGYDFRGYQGPGTAIFLSPSVITTVVGGPGDGYQTVSNPGFTYAIRLGANNQFDVYSLSGSSLVTAFYAGNRGLPRIS